MSVGGKECRKKIYVFFQGYCWATSKKENRMVDFIFRAGKFYAFLPFIELFIYLSEEVQKNSEHTLQNLT